jgi:hypothetical protein
MLRHDLAGYILLGDPAVTLPFTREVQAARPQAPEARASSVLGMPVAAASPKPSADVMAEAVLAMLLGEESPKAIAERVGVTLQELRRWEQAYKDAGRAAMERLRS